MFRKEDEGGAGCVMCNNTGKGSLDQECECPYGAKVRLAKSRQQIQFLLNEDELRLAAFIVIINVWKEDAELKKDDLEWGPGMVGSDAKRVGEHLCLKDIEASSESKR